MQAYFANNFYELRQRERKNMEMVALSGMLEEGKEKHSRSCFFLKGKKPLLFCL